MTVFVLGGIVADFELPGSGSINTECIVNMGRRRARSEISRNWGLEIGF